MLLSEYLSFNWIRPEIKHVQSHRSRVQVAFNLYKYFRKFLSTLHGVRIVWIFILLDEFFLCFQITGRRGQCFIAPLQAEIILAKFFQAGSLQKFCLTFHSVFTCMYAWSVVQCLQVVWYVLWRVQPHLQCSTVLTSLFTACHVIDVLVASTVCVPTWVWPGIRCPEFQEE